MDGTRVSWKWRLRVWWARWRLPALLARFDEEKVIAAFSAISGGVSLGILTLAAGLTSLPLMFPPLGPSAFILFTMPMSKTAASRTVVLGHGVSLLAGLFAWHLCAWTGASPFVAAAIAFAVASTAMLTVDAPHPPAAATALVVALGMVQQWWHPLVLMAAVVALVAQAALFSRLVGLPKPLWRFKSISDDNPFDAGDAVG